MIDKRRNQGLTMALVPWAYEFQQHCGQRLLLKVDLSIFLLFYPMIVALNYLFSKSLSLQMKILNITPFQIGCTIVYVSIGHMCGGRDNLSQKFAIGRRVFYLMLSAPVAFSVGLLQPQYGAAL